jgi:hypothetical protein
MAWLSRWSAVLSVALAFGVVYAIDRCTSNELSLFPLYLIPIGLALFNFGPVAGYGASALASLLWLNAELLSPSRAYSQAWIPLQAMAARGLVFLLITWLLCLYTSSNRTARHRLNNLQRVLPICHDCGSILCHDGQWRSLEQVIQNPSSIVSLPAHHCVHAPENPSRHRNGQPDLRRPD